MRRTQIVTAIIVAVITMTSLHFFLGPAYTGRWYGYHGYNRYWFHPDTRSREWRDVPFWERFRAPADSTDKPAY